MTTTSAQIEIVDGYLQALAARQNVAQYLTPDVTFELVGTGQVVSGREPVTEFIRYGHEIAFNSAIEIASTTVGRDGASFAVELIFTGPHIGDFASIAPTGREVRVPYSVHYEIENSQISAARIYGLAAGLISSLTS